MIGRCGDSAPEQHRSPKRVPTKTSTSFHVSQGRADLPERPPCAWVRLWDPLGRFPLSGSLL